GFRVDADVLADGRGRDLGQEFRAVFRPQVRKGFVIGDAPQIVDCSADSDVGLPAADGMVVHHASVPASPWVGAGNTTCVPLEAPRKMTLSRCWGVPYAAASTSR